jgi:hypothetical protein
MMQPGARARTELRVPADESDYSFGEKRLVRRCVGQRPPVWANEPPRTWRTLWRREHPVVK